jgi:glycosyltransferase involved in cell wall biosynthesis
MRTGGTGRWVAGLAPRGFEVDLGARALISIVTVCYNAADFVEQCIESVCAQSLGEVDYVIIDGGSTDGTVDIIARHARRLSYWRSSRDRGIGHAFNLGVANSRGEWVLFLNADDYLCRPDALRVLADHAPSSGADVVYGQVQPVTREGTPRPVGAAVGSPYSPWLFLLRDLIPHPAALTSRAYLDRAGPFREDLRIAVDYELYLRAYRTLRTVFVPLVLTYMRVGGRSYDAALAHDEMFRAHALNEVLPPVPRALLRSFVRAKAFLGRTLRAARGGLRGTTRRGHNDP